MKLRNIFKTAFYSAANLSDDAKKRNPADERPWVVVMDGASGLWKAAAVCLTGIEWTGILNIIHAVEYLWKVGNSLYGEKTPESEKWVYKHLLSILQGRAGYVIGGLKQTLKKREKNLKTSQIKALAETIRCFENHRQWMKYSQYPERGYPIGSGIVESTCGHTVKKRTEGTGRRWSVKGAEAMLRLISVYTSNDRDAYRSEHTRKEFVNLYGRTLNTIQYPDDYNAISLARYIAPLINEISKPLKENTVMPSQSPGSSIKGISV